MSRQMANSSPQSHWQCHGEQWFKFNSADNTPRIPISTHNNSSQPNDNTAAMSYNASSMEFFMSSPLNGAGNDLENTPVPPMPLCYMTGLHDVQLSAARIAEAGYQYIQEDSTADTAIDYKIYNVDTIPAVGAETAMHAQTAEMNLCPAVAICTSCGRQMQHSENIILQPPDSLMYLPTPYTAGPLLKTREPESLLFVYEGRRGVRLDLALSGLLQGLLDAGYRGFFKNHDFAEKVSYKILRKGQNAYTRQKRCRYMRRKEPVYLSREEIVVQVAEFTRDFIKAVPDFYMDPAFEKWSAAPADLENFVLLEVKKAGRACVRPIFEYCPSA